MTPGAEGGPADPLDEEQQALLWLLARGLTVAEAAECLHTSPRTAERRLAEARAALRAATNAEALLRAQAWTVGEPRDDLSPREWEAIAKLDGRTRVEAVSQRVQRREPGGRGGRARPAPPTSGSLIG